APPHPPLRGTFSHGGRRGDCLKRFGKRLPLPLRERAGVRGALSVHGHSCWRVGLRAPLIRPFAFGESPLSSFKSLHWRDLPPDIPQSLKGRREVRGGAAVKGWRWRIA